MLPHRAPPCLSSLVIVSVIKGHDCELGTLAARVDSNVIAMTREMIEDCIMNEGARIGTGCELCKKHGIRCEDGRRFG